MALRFEGPAAAAAEVTIAGPGAPAFQLGSAGLPDGRWTVTAAAPGLARLVVAVHGRVILQIRVACRGLASGAAEHCARAIAQHRARLAALDDFISSLVERLADAGYELDRQLRTRAAIAPQLSDAREVAMLLSDPAPDDAREALALLRAVWSRVARFGVATRAIAILAPSELATSARPATPPATVAELVAQIRAAIAREQPWVTALLEAWPTRLRLLTARAPDLELEAGIGACTADVSALPRMWWRTWFHEHALVIHPDDDGPRAAWRTGRGLLAQLGVGASVAWQDAVVREVDQVAAAVAALRVL